MEKKARQKKLDEIQKKHDAKFAAEMEERRRIEEDKRIRKQMELDKKKNEIEFNIRMRKENR